MSTFAKRATPRQMRVFRMIEGAVRNATHAHPDYKIPPRFANSVAKRAAGTLTSQWGSVLAMPLSASSGDEGNSFATSRLVGRGKGSAASGKGPGKLCVPALVHLHRAVGRMAGNARRQDSLALDVLVEVLRLIRAEMDRT